MPRLSEAVKTYVVQRLACFDTPTQVVELVKETFGLELSRQHVAHYDPTGRSTSAKWRAVFDATRTAWLAAKAEVGIAHERYRLEQLQRMYDRAMRMGQHGNIPLALSILEQAAKEQGGAFTNRHRLDHSGKVEGGVLLVPVASADEWDQHARAQQAVRLTVLPGGGGSDG